MISKYLSLVKFSHTIFALPFAFIGFVLAVNEYGFNNGYMLLGAVILCMVFARSAAMGFNRYLDRDIDILNERTAVREIPAGKISPKAALIFTITTSLLFIATTWFINPLCFYLSPVALLVILGYSYTKRFTFLCHIILGLGLSLAPIGAYLAVSGEFALLPILFSFIVLSWTAGFDIIYALQDEEFDRSKNLFSIPAYFGRKKALYISLGIHAITATLIIFAGILGNFYWLYWLGSSLFITFLIFQHSIVSPNNISRVNMAFATSNGVGSVLFGVFTICDILIL